MTALSDFRCDFQNFPRIQLKTEKFRGLGIDLRTRVCSEKHVLTLKFKDLMLLHELVLEIQRSETIGLSQITYGRQNVCCFLCYTSPEAKEER